MSNALTENAAEIGDRQPSFGSTFRKLLTAVAVSKPSSWRSRRGEIREPGVHSRHRLRLQNVISNFVSGLNPAQQRSASIPGGRNIGKISPFSAPPRLHGVLTTNTRRGYVVPLPGRFADPYLRSDGARPRARCTPIGSASDHAVARAIKGVGLEHHCTL